MFNLETIGESIRRHWIPVVVVTILMVTLGAASSFKGGEASVEPQYTAEASLYVTGYEEAPDTRSYNYQLTGSEDMLITDARRVVVSNEVAGDIRRQFGEDVTVSSPFWVNEKSNGNFYTRFIFVDVTASKSETALEAANLAAEKAADIIEKTLPVSEVSVASAAALSSVQGQAADFGKDAFAVDVDPIVAVASGINMKNLVIYGFVGIVGSIIAFAAYDILSRRVRSARDIERLLSVPSLATVKNEDDYAFLAEDVRVLLDRNALASVVVAGCVEGDGASRVAEALAQQGLDVAGSVSVADDPEAVKMLAQAQGIVVVLGYAAARGRDLDRLSEALRIAGTPVVGSVFVPRKRR